MPHDDAASILGEADFFDICTQEERRILAFTSERKRFSAGSVIAASGEVLEGLIILISGTISVTPDSESEPNPYLVSERGALIGALALMIAKPRPVTLSAVTIVEVLVVPRKSFLKLASQSPELAVKARDRVRAELGAYVEALSPIRSLMEKK